MIVIYQTSHRQKAGPFFFFTVVVVVVVVLFVIGKNEEVIKA